MKCLNVFLLFAILTAGSIYGFVRLFSRLSGVDMFEALSPVISSKDWWIVLVAGIFYLFTFACLLVLLRKPMLLFDMNATHEGALQGGTIGYEERLYDPARREYRTYADHPYSGAAKTFDETFKVVAFYRDHRWGNYVSVDFVAEGPVAGIIVLFFVCLMFLVYYMALFKLAGSHGHALSHQMMLANFRQLTGLPFPTAAATALVIVLVPWLMGGYMAHRIKRGYEEQFSPVQKELKSELMASVAPKKVVKGRVVGRVRGYDQEPVSREGRSPSARDYRRIPTVIYTIEFRGLIRHTPVYLDIKRRNYADDPVIKRLDPLSPPEKDVKAGEKSSWSPAREADALQETEFIVNDDYSVSLAGSELLSTLPRVKRDLGRAMKGEC